MTAFVCVVLFIALISVTAKNSVNNVTLQPLVLDSFEGDQGKSLTNINTPQNRFKTKNTSQNKLMLNGELMKDSYLRTLLENQTRRNKLIRNIDSVDDFWNQRNAIADAEVELLFGNSLPLDEKELKANEIILAKKYQEYTKDIFPPSVHFFQAKHLIEESEIFKIIKKLPKGANLYNMLITSAGSDFMYQLTFEDDLYFRFEEKLKLTYSKERPAFGWRLLSYLRATDNTEYIQDLNNAIKESLIFNIPALTRTEPGSTSVISQLSDLLDIYNSLITFKPNFIKTFRKVLQVFYENNIMYAELRYHFPDLYDLDGKIFKPTETLQLCKSILNDFKKTHRDFIGIRFIYTPQRNIQPPEFRKIMTPLWESNPDFIAGLGLGSLDDDQEPISYFVNELLKLPKEINIHINIGPTNKWGFDSDYNLLDALTLNATRIGEPTALIKHPTLLQQLRQKGIAAEFSPISAQVLNCVTDIRNHPLTFLVATNFPLVIGNSGGAFWNTTGLSYDWYETYLAMTPRFCDLRCLKQFAINSLLYSTSSVTEKKRNLLAWVLAWNKFIDYVIAGNYY